MQKTPHGAGLQQLPFVLSQLEVGVLAEKVGFEPTVPCGTPDFESGTFGHSATSPVSKKAIVAAALVVWPALHTSKHATSPGKPRLFCVCYRLQGLANLAEVH